MISVITCRNSKGHERKKLTLPLCSGIQANFYDAYPGHNWRAYAAPMHDMTFQGASNAEVVGMCDQRR
jgi:hypothetical protein